MKALGKAREAAAAFLSPIQERFWEEHGISDDEATRGAIAALRSVGVFRRCDARDALLELADEELAERNRQARARRLRWSKMTDEERERAEKARIMFRTSYEVQTKILERIYAASPAFNVIRSRP